MQEKWILVAGATGYLGQFLVKACKQHGYRVRAFSRSREKLSHLGEYIDDLFIGEVTKPDSLKGVCDNIDYVISAVGITRQKDGLSYMDVDYQGNKNLLDRAIESEVSRFMYVSVLNAHLMMNLKIIQAKEKFVTELSQSGMDSLIIRPNGFFSDMLEFLKMARKGKVQLFGNGEYRMNPIHGEDLAEVCVNALQSTESKIDVGGPDMLSHRQIAALAFEALGKEPKISYTPLWMKNPILFLLRLFTSSKTYGPIEFFMTALTMDGIAPEYGRRRLKDFFAENA